MLHGHGTLNLTPKVLTRFYSVIRTNLLTMLHEDRTINVTSRVQTRETARSPGGHKNVMTNFREDRTINVTSRVFELDQDIISTIVWAKFHKDQTSNVAS
ncbi:hypothetical protein DPMN_143281 [Dreissena polymorpha]|uniref:Uncharacterized protein n=1 Tax=Dreissena polymorpha TaxID=45954 RepID=A0A9D4GCM7_DREPO|nr:hypothetical protein DPMN_143281 [Dreissena polymorpha]